MPRLKTAKKVAKKVKASNVEKDIKSFFKYINGCYDLCDIQEDQIRNHNGDIKRLGYAIWALVAFDVIITYALLYLL